MQILTQCIRNILHKVDFLHLIDTENLTLPTYVTRQKVSDVNIIFKVIFLKESFRKALCSESH